MIQPRARDVRTELKSLLTSTSIKGFKIYIQPLSRKGETGGNFKNHSTQFVSIARKKIQCIRRKCALIQKQGSTKKSLLNRIVPQAHITCVDREKCEKSGARQKEVINQLIF